MPQDRAHTPYEVYCNRCRVTFAAGTRKCVHCGARLSRERGNPRLEIELPPGLEDVGIEEETPRRSGISPFTLVWVALLIAGYLYRACAT